MGKANKPAIPGLRFAGSIVAGAIALLSLLVTYQLLWSGFNELSNRLSGHFLWLSPEIQTSPEQYGITKTTAGVQHFHLISPPATAVLVSTNGSPHEITSSHLGGVEYDAHLHKGLNRIEFSLNDNVNGIFDYQNRILDYHESSSAPPILISAWRHGNTLNILGFGEPGSATVIRNESYKVSEIGAGDATDGSFVVNASGTFPPPETPRLTFIVGDRNPPDEVELNRSATRDFYLRDHSFSRTLDISLSPGTYHVTGHVVLPVATTLNQDAGAGAFTASQLLAQVFGICMDVDQLPKGEPGRLSTSLDCSFGPPVGSDTPVISESPGSLAFELHGSFHPGALRIRRIPHSPLSSTFLQFPDDSLSLSVSGGSAEALAAPSESSQNTLKWRGDAAAVGERTEVATVTFPGGSEVGSKAAGPPKSSISTETDTIIDRVRQIEKLMPNTLQRTLYTLIAAIPFFWFLRILKAYAPASSTATILRAIVSTVLVLHLAVLALSVFEASLGAWVFDLAQALIHNDSVQSKVVRILQSFQPTYPFLAIAMALLVRPVYRAFLKTAPMTVSLATVFVRSLLWIVFWLIVIGAPAGAIWLRYSSMNPDGKQEIWGLGVLGAGSLLLLWFIVYWLFHRICRISITVKSAIRACTAMVLLPLFPPLTEAAVGWLRNLVVTSWGFYPRFLPVRGGPYVWMALATLLAATLLWQTGFLTFRMAPDRKAWAWIASRPRLLIFLSMAVVCLPVINARYSSVYTLSSFFYRVDNLLLYALLGGVLSLTLLLNPSDEFTIPDGALQLGSLVFAIYLCGLNALLFIPITMLAGRYMFRHWLLVDAPPPAESTSAVIRAYINERRASSTAADVQKGLSKKLAAGEITLSEYHSKYGEAQSDATYARASLIIASGNRKPQVFSFGSEDGPWKNARIAACYGSVIALPFMLTTFSATLKRQASDFPILDLAYAALASSAGWIVAAGVFGYFYHRIRGRNGFEKALWFALASIIPTLPLRLLSGEQLIQPGSLLGVVPMLLFLLVLALTAFDLRTLRKQHFGWRELFTVYGFASAAYGSTIALATAVSLWGKDLIPILSKALAWAGASK